MMRNVSLFIVHLNDAASVYPAGTGAARLRGVCTRPRDAT